MITNLHIKNIGIIEEINIELNQGLIVLTGETGAGKTLIIDSLSILCGNRFPKEIIRKGEEYSFIEACFYEPNHEQSIEGNIIVSREVHHNGRNSCKINGRMVTVNELKEFMKSMIEIHGQNDNQDLLSARYHLNYLDGFVGENLIPLKQEYRKKYEQVNQIKQKLKQNYGDEKERERQLDLLKYQAKEIQEAGLTKGEEEELENKRTRMANAEKIAKNLQEADINISENAIECLSTAIRALEKIEQLDTEYETITSNLKNSYYELQEMARDINHHREEIDFDEEERNQVEERLDLIYSLKRKYGNTIEEIIQYGNKIENEIEHIEHLEGDNQKLRQQQKQIEEEMNILAQKIHEQREEKAKQLNQKINQELEELEMKQAKINVQVEKQEEFFNTGKDKVTFYLTTNLGEEEKELAKIASGGEMSRIMLAIKKVLADSDKTPVLIFDEIDTGISGKAANCVAQKLKHIAKTHQVLCISHLPNIAAMADENYYISKKIKGERTKTEIKKLNEKQTIEEIARISSGEINEVSLQYAYELRNKQKEKRSA
jgi:DNA repair protein RecN (Recombination protein N)